MSARTADRALELFPQVVRALRAVEWTCEAVGNAHGALFCPECSQHSPLCPCDDCSDEGEAGVYALSHDEECTIGKLITATHFVTDEPAPGDIAAAEVAEVEPTGTEPALAPGDFLLPGHISIVEHPQFFKTDRLYNVDIRTTLCLTHSEIGDLADFLANVSCDDLAGEVNEWLEQNPAKCWTCGKAESADEGWVGICDDCAEKEGDDEE